MYFKQQLVLFQNPAAYGALMSVISAGLNWTERTESFLAVGA